MLGLTLSSWATALSPHMLSFISSARTATLSLFNVPALFCDRTERVLVVGGLDKSGAKYVQAMLNSHPSLVCFGQNQVSKLIPLAANFHGRNESLGWKDRDRQHADTIHYFRMSDQELRWRAIYDWISSLPETSPRTRPENNSRNDFDFTSESYFELANAISPLATYYVHCVRDPIANLQAQWQMPWVVDLDPMTFAEGFLANMEASQRLYDNLEAEGAFTTIVRVDRLWNRATHSHEMEELCSKFGVSATEFPNDLKTLSIHDDKTTGRKQLAEISTAVIERVNRDQRISRWRHRFGL